MFDLTSLIPKHLVNSRLFQISNCWQKTIAWVKKERFISNYVLFNYEIYSTSINIFRPIKLDNKQCCFSAVFSTTTLAFKSECCLVSSATLMTFRDWTSLSLLAENTRVLTVVVLFFFRWPKSRQPILTEKKKLIWKTIAYPQATFIVKVSSFHPCGTKFDLPMRVSYHNVEWNFSKSFGGKRFLYIIS